MQNTRRILTSDALFRQNSRFLRFIRRLFHPAADRKIKTLRVFHKPVENRMSRSVRIPEKVSPASTFSASGDTARKKLFRLCKGFRKTPESLSDGPRLTGSFNRFHRELFHRSADFSASGASFARSDSSENGVKKVFHNPPAPTPVENKQHVKFAISESSACVANKYSLRLKETHFAKRNRNISNA